jgi:hypothetical protein
MDARFAGALVFCGAGIAMTAAVVELLRRSGRQLLAGIGDDGADRASTTTGRFGRVRADAATAMRGLSNLLAGCLFLATCGFVLHDISTLWEPDGRIPSWARVIHQQSASLGWYVLVFGVLYLFAVLIMLGFRTHLRRAAQQPVVTPGWSGPPYPTPTTTAR